MSLGPGRYDDACTVARKLTDASLVALIVIDGLDGHGFSVQTRDPALATSLPAVLRDVADQIEADGL